MNSKFFDSHAHYDDPRFEAEFDGGGEEAIKKSRNIGVSRIINVGSNIDTSKHSIAIAEKFDFLFAAVGIHPSDAQDILESDITNALSEIDRLASSSKKVAAIGEIGFDYHYDGTDKERQKYFFSAQIEIARKRSLPVIIHTRDATADTVDLLRKSSYSNGVIHSFSGSAEIARQLSSDGWYISFSGPVTYKNAPKIKEAARIIPDELLLIETDSPYLPPHPHRGEINYSGYLNYICAALAELRGTTPEYIADLTYRNACRLFGVK